MKFFQFFLGIIIAQATLYLLWLLNSDSSGADAVLRIGAPSLIIALVLSLWFVSILHSQSKEAQNRIKMRFANEREKIKLNAERAKMRAHKEAEKKIIKETAKAHAKANFKVGAAFAGLIGVGTLFVMAQMVTAGLLLISTGAGAAGGYYLRGKRERSRKLEMIDATLSAPTPKKIKGTKHE